MGNEARDAPVAGDVEIERDEGADGLLGAPAADTAHPISLVRSAGRGVHSSRSSCSPA